jgi:hypothetical protein
VPFARSSSIASPSARPWLQGDVNTAEDRRSILYLIGSGRSGTTLLSRLLHLEKAHVALGEVGFLGNHDWWDYPCGCGVSHSACPEWGPRIRSIRERRSQDLWFSAVTAAQPAQLAYFALRRWPAPRLREGQQYLSSLYRSFGSADTVFVDESKHPWLGFLLANDAAFDVRFVELVRDPDDVVESWRHTKSYLPAFAPERAAKLWLWSALTGELVRRRSGRPWLRLPYTQLVNDPHGALASVLGREPSGLRRQQDGWTFEAADNHLYLSNADKLQRGTQVIRSARPLAPRATEAARGPWQRAARQYWQRWLEPRAHLEYKWTPLRED